MLTDLQQNRRIIQDFTENSLAAIPEAFGRLTYMASLRDLSTGRYEHSGLVAVYPEGSVQQALTRCHEEIFEGILERPLEEQERDLRACLGAMREGLPVTVRSWKRLESYRVLMPEASPEYLKELFCSNLRALLEIVGADGSKARSSA